MHTGSNLHYFFMKKVELNVVHKKIQLMFSIEQYKY